MATVVIEDYVLAQAADEIRKLRRKIELLEAKVSVIELFSLVLHTKPAYPEVVMGEDIAYTLDRIVVNNAPVKKS